MLWAWLTNETRNKVEDEAPCSRYLVLLLRHIFVAFAHFSYRSSSCYVTAPLAMYIKSEAVGGGGGGVAGNKKQVSTLVWSAHAVGSCFHTS